MNRRFKNKTKQQVAVIGLGRFGTEMTRYLYSNGCDVMAVDIAEERTLAVADYAVHTLVADASDESTLKRMGIESFDTVVIAIGEMQPSIVCALNCLEMKVENIIAKARDEKHAKILEKIGIKNIVIPEADSAIKTAVGILNPNVGDIMELAVGYDVAVINTPHEWKGKTIKELDLRNIHGVNILTVIRDGQIISPLADTLVKEDDKFIIGGLAAVIFGGNLVVNNASQIAVSFGVSQNFIGLTIVAIGTSLPELVTSIVAARKNEVDMALGNAIGSNVFNILMVLGIASAISPISIITENIIDLCVLIAFTVCVWIFAGSKKKIGSVEGFCMVALYAAYAVYIIIR